MEQKKIELTPFLFALFSKHMEAEQRTKDNFKKDLKILFDAKGIEMPINFKFELKDNAIFYSEE